MLRKFCVENYKSFNEKTTLDFTDVKKYNFNSDCVKNGLINKFVILGKNASGKTNLGFALFDIVYTLTNYKPNRIQVEPSSFLNGNSKKRAASFYYEFQFGKDIVRYEYHKTQPFKVVYESLEVNDTIIFVKKGPKSSNYDNLGKIGVNIDLIKEENFFNIPLLRLIAFNTPQKKESPVTKIINFVSNMLFFRSSLEGNNSIGPVDDREVITQYILEKNLVNDFEKFLKEYANITTDLCVLQSPISRELGQRFDKKILPFLDISSSGTKALTLYYYWKKKASEVSLLYMDEFDAYYHYILSERILKEVLDHSEFQSILTTHNTDLVDNMYMRPDCYLVIIDGQIKSFSNITDRELREGNSLRKLLIGGEFDE